MVLRNGFSSNFGKNTKRRPYVKYAMSVRMPNAWNHGSTLNTIGSGAAVASMAMDGRTIY